MLKRSIHHWFVGFCWVLFQILVPSVPAQTYHLKDLGVLLSGTNSYASGINNSGAIVGYWDTLTNGFHAFRYTNGVMLDLGSLGGTNHYALSINAAGNVVGFGEVSGGIRAFLYDENGLTNLGTLGGDNSYAYGINTNGVIVGYIDTSSGARAVLLDSGSVTNLGTLGGTNSFAFAINASKQIVGASLLSGNADLRAFIWETNSLVDLNSLLAPGAGWTLLDARAINLNSRIVGWGISNSQERAFLYTNGTIIDLGILASGTNSFGFALNNLDHVVGMSSIDSGGTDHAFVWKQGQLSDLNDLIVTNSNWVLKEGRGINDAGQIVGWGITNNQEHAFVLTPNVPPAVSITTPTNNSSFEAPVAVTITASASDSDGTVSKVEFYRGSTKIGESTSSPFTITWEDAFAGQHALTAVATDDFNSKSTSAVVNVSIDLPAKASLKLWLKTETLSALADGAAVSTWSDSSGGGNDATQSNGSFRPNYWTNQINGRPIVRFDGSNDGLDLPDLLSGSSQAEVYIIHKATQALPGADKGFWHIGNANTFTGYPVFGGGIADNFANNTLRTTGIPNQAIDQFHMYHVVSKSGEWTSRINGLIHFTSGVNTVAFTTSPSLGKSFYSFAGDIAEVLIYNGVLTAAQRASVGAYLESRFAFVGSAPSTPSSLTADAISSTQVSLNWSYTLGSASTRFLIERKTGSGGTYAQIAAVEDVLSYLDSSTSSGTQYFYRVRASNYAGKSDYSSEANVTTPSTGTDLPLSNLKLWLKADAGLIKQGSSGTISAWLDQSGNNNHASQTTASAQPQRIASGVNSRPTVRFDGSNDYFELPDFLSGFTAGEIYVVHKATQSPPSSTKGLWNLGTGNSGTTYPDTSRVISDNFGNNSLRWTSVPSQPLTNFHLYNVVSKSGEWTSRINGLLHFTSAQNTVAFTTTPTIGKGLYAFAGDIAELLIFNRALTSDERFSVGTYLNQRFALVSSAPAVPGSLAAIAVSPSQVSLSWSNNLSTAMTRFLVERKTGSGGSYSQIAALEDATSFLDTNRTAATQSDYRVMAANYAGASAYSDEADATTPSSGADIPMASLKLWLKGDSGVALQQTNRTVAFWLDQSGSGNHAVELDGPYQPQRITNAITSRPVIRFDGSDDFFDLPNVLSGASSAEVLAVLKVTTDPPGSGKGFWRFGRSQSGSIFYPNSDGTISDDFGSKTLKFMDNPAQALDQYHIYAVSSKVGEWVARLNSTRHHYDTANVVAIWDTPTLGKSSPYFAGDFAELLIFNRALTLDEHEAAGNYLRLKYGVSGSAPSTPVSLLATGLSDSQIRLTWARGSSDESSFRIERKVGSGGTYAELGSVLGGITNYVDTGLSPTTEYYYRVRALNYWGNSSYSSAVAPPVGTITAPANLAALTVGFTNTITASASDPDGSVTNVEFLASGTSISNDSSSPYSANWITNVVNTYSLTVKVTDDGGNSRLSAPIKVVLAPDTDGDGLNDLVEIALGTNPYLADTDGDGVSDLLDAFPLDPSRSTVPGVDPSDHTPPTITLTEPAGAVLLP